MRREALADVEGEDGEDEVLRRHLEAEDAVDLDVELVLGGAVEELVYFLFHDFLFVAHMII